MSGVLSWLNLYCPGLYYRGCVLVTISLLSTTSAFAGSTTSPAISAQPSGGVYGDWVPPDGDAIIHIDRCSESGKKLCAQLVQHAYSDLSKKDALNADADLRDRPLIGVNILEGLKMSGTRSWKGGDLYDPRTGKTYHAKVKLLSETKLKIIGCIAPGLCKGYVWKRAQPDTELTPGNLAVMTTTTPTPEASPRS